MTDDTIVPFPGQDPRAEIMARIRAAAAVEGSPGDGTTVPAPSPAPPSSPSGHDSSHLGAGAEGDREGGARPPAEDSERGHDRDWHHDAAQLPLTDLGNAQRFVLRHGDAFVFVPEWGWLAWDGRRWNRDQADGLVARAVHATILAIAEEARAWKVSGDDQVVKVSRGETVYRSDQIRGWGLASQGNAHISCVARLAQPYLQASVEDFDADPMALNVLNGTLRFGKGGEGEDYVRFTPHDRADRLTRLAPVTYDPDATCPAYDAMLGRVQPDPVMVRHIHCWGGLSLTGDVSPQRMVFWFGDGGNGKSTVLDAWAHVVGGYASTINVESFLDQGRTRKGSDATPDLADLVGVRMLKTSEPERGAKLAEALIKTATGDEALKVRFLNKEFFPLRVSFHLTMFGNERPRIGGTDEGIWRRVTLVPWEVKIPEEERDRGLLVRLKTEASGILNRLLDGVRDYLDNGLVLPDKVKQATADYRQESDPVGRFLDVCTAFEDGGRVQSSSLHRLYQGWCVANGEKAWSANAFGRALRGRGLKSKTSNVVWWLDLKTTASLFDFVTDPDAPPDRWRAKRHEGGGEGGGDLLGGDGGGDDGGGDAF